MQLKKISKTTAKKAFERGETIYLLPSKVNLMNEWVKPFAIKLGEEQDFDKAYLNYWYYNTNSELGKTVYCYIEATK